MKFFDERRLDRLVDHYERTFAAAHEADRERYRAMPDLETAIRNAALARTADDKREAHQRRIPHEALSEFERSLQGLHTPIRAAETFEALLELVRGERIEGIGPLTVYDTAVRIGAHLGLAPERVHLHAGVTIGARALGVDTSGASVAIEDLPEPLRRLSADDLENFLCIYKDALDGGELPGGGSLSCATARGGCGGCSKRRGEQKSCARRRAA